MLTKGDLKAIRGLIVETVEPIVDKKIEELAIMTARGFVDISNRMATKNEVNKRFEEIDGRFQKIEDRFEEVGDRFDRLEYKVAQGFDILTDKLKLVSVRVGI